MQTAAPLLALRFGASAWFLGMLGFTAQTVRLPFCMTMGSLSERVGRVKIIAPAALVMVGGTVGLAVSRNNAHVLVAYIFAVASLGAFYPPLQALIGDHSPRGELTRNLSWFNIGWCAGGSVLALSAGYLLHASKPLPFAVSALMAGAALVLVLGWHSNSRRSKTAQIAVPQSLASSGPLLLIARLGHFLGFFALAIGRNIFPKLAQSLGFDEGEIGILVGMLLVGQAVGILIANVGPWWKDRIWPQVLAQVLVLIGAIAVFLTASGLVIAVCFLGLGVSLGIAYTAALYYGMQSRMNMGRNTSIHESLVALGNILGALCGGAAAQYVSLAAPYALIAILAAAFLATTGVISVISSASAR